MYRGKNVSGRESVLYIWPRKPFQPTYHCIMGELTPEYLKGLILGTPQAGKGARNPFLGLYGIKEREESNKDPIENVSGKERIRERFRTIYMATKAMPTYLPLPRGGFDPRVSLRVNLGTPRVGKGARNPLLGLYGIKERKDPT